MSLTRNWWVLLARGILALVFGILALTNPKVTLAVIVVFAAAYLIVDGILSVTAALTAAERGRGWGWLLLGGLVGIAAGILMFVWPRATALLLLYLIVAWLIMMGVLMVVAAVRLRRQIRGELWLAAAGALSVLFGLYLVLNPGTGLSALLWLIGVYAAIFGLMMILASLQLRHVDALPG